MVPKMITQTPGSSIPEILKIVSQSLSGNQFNVVHEMLLDRERMVLVEIRDLKEDLCLKRRESRLLEMEKLSLEKKLQKSQRICEELSEEIARLGQEHKASCDRARRAEESHEILSKEFSKMITGKIQLILELNGKITELQTKCLENEQLVVKHKERSKSLEAKVDKLRAGKLSTDQVEAELEGQKCEAARSLDELGHETMECDDRLENLAPEVLILETKLANILNVKVEDLASLSDFVERSSPEKRRADLPGIIKRWKRSSAHVGTFNSTESDDIPSVAKGSHDSVSRTPGGAQHPSKLPVSSSAATEVIEICDSDDESKHIFWAKQENEMMHD